MSVTDTIKPKQHIEVANGILNIQKLAIQMASFGARKRLDIWVEPVDEFTLDYLSAYFGVSIQKELGLKTIGALDIRNQCSGFIYALTTGAQFIETGRYKKVVIVGADMMSRIIDYTDRTTCVIFGDGAGAAIVGPSDSPGISKSVWGSDGSKWEAVGMTGSLLDFRDGTGSWPTLVQEGQSVFRWAVWEMVKVAKEALEVAGVKPEELAALVTHQANERIIDEMAKQLALPESVVVAKDIITTGNTSAASIPLAMHALLAEGRIKSGDLALQIGFGAGLAYGAQVVVVP